MPSGWYIGRLLEDAILEVRPFPAFSCSCLPVEDAGSPEGAGVLLPPLFLHPIRMPCDSPPVSLGVLIEYEGTLEAAVLRVCLLFGPASKIAFYIAVTNPKAAFFF